MGGETTSTVAELTEDDLKPGQFIFLEIYSSKFTTGCRLGMPSGQLLFVAEPVVYFGVLREDSQKAVEFNNEGVRICTKNLVLLSGRESDTAGIASENGVFVDYEHFGDVLKVVKLCEGDSLSNMRTAAFLNAHSSLDHSGCIQSVYIAILRTSVLMPKLLSVNIYMGDNRLLSDGVIKGVGPFRAYDAFTELGIKCSEQLAERLRTESEKWVLDLYNKFMTSNNKDQYHDNERDLRERLRELNEKRVTRFVECIRPSPGVTIVVSEFLKGVEDKLASTVTDTRKRMASF